MKADLPILLAEDDENDILLLERAVRKGGFENPVYICRDGEETIEYLRGVGKYADRSVYPFPDVLILDIKMPRKTGLEVLRWLRDHPECFIPKAF